MANINNIPQRVIMGNASDKMYRLQELLEELGDDKTAIVFTNTKKSADSLTKALDKAGYRVTSIHAGKSPTERTTSLSGFSTKRYNVLVSTDVSGQQGGVELPHGDHVINYEIPANIDTFIRQTGRAGKTGGIATTFFSYSPYSWQGSDLIGEITQMLIQSKSPVQQDLRQYCKRNDLL